MSRWDTVTDTELADRLASELRELVHGAHPVDDWLRLELLPVVRSNRRGADRQQASVSRAAALAGIAGILSLVAVIAVVAFLRLPAGDVGTSPPPFIETGPDGLRTFAVVREIGGVPVTCPLFEVIDPVVGRLEGSPDDPVEPIWLVGPNGNRLSVVWPRGYSVAFEPEAVLRDADGRVVATAGERIELAQVRVGASSGTYEDPYIASGFLFGNCNQADFRLLPSPTSATDKPNATVTADASAGLTPHQPARGCSSLPATPRAVADVAG
jgi:hypothetical protein